MDPLVLRTYRQIRRENPRFPAQYALAVAKRRHTQPPWADEFSEDRDGVFTGEVHGFAITISSEIDDDQDISWLGTFTDDPDGAVKNPGYDGPNTYKYFHPDNVETIEELRARGFSRAGAEAERTRRAEEAAQSALEPQYIVSVAVSRGDVEILTNYLGGCYIDSANDLLWTVHDHGMIDEAISQAEDSLKRAGLRRVED